MKNHRIQDRVHFYEEAFPDWPAPRIAGRFLEGMWILGNNYRNKSRLYGAYPPGYVSRVMALFPDAEHTLHLFSGSIPKWDGTGQRYTTFDLSGEADVVGDASHLSDHFTEGDVDLILADPPYSVEDAEHYGTTMIKRTVVMRECAKVLRPGGYIVWLDQVMPMFKKKHLDWCGVIGMVRSTNHRFRVVTIFYKGLPYVEDDNV